MHTDRPVLSTGAYLDFKRHGGPSSARASWPGQEALVLTFGRLGRDPTYSLRPVLMSGAHAAMNVLWLQVIGVWFRRTVLVQDGTSASEGRVESGEFAAVSVDGVWSGGPRPASGRVSAPLRGGFSWERCFLLWRRFDVAGEGGQALPSRPSKTRSVWVATLWRQSGPRSKRLCRPLLQVWRLKVPGKRRQSGVRPSSVAVSNS